MGLKSMSLQAAATITASDGTALAFTDDGVSIQNGLHLIVPADTDYQTRRQVTVKYRPPALDSKTGVYGKDKKSISMAFPVDVHEGRIIFNTIRIEREVHPSYGSNEVAEMNKLGAQLLVALDTENFWANGSLS